MIDFDCILQILSDELVPAMGCTEPIAVAYAAAIAADTLKATPERAVVSVSGNILKNVKSVIVPNTGGLKGIASAVAAGIIAGGPERKLEILSTLTENDRARIREYLEKTPICVEKAVSECIFDIGVRVFAGEDTAFVRIVGQHTNVVTIEKNGESLLSGLAREAAEVVREVLDIKSALEFVKTVPLEKIEFLINRQIEYNSAIAKEGLKNDYGARIGKILLKAYGDEVYVRAKAMAAAGSDARMNGCGLPVVIVSGSGNQGMTASLPVLVYAEHLGVSRETLLRAVALSDLVTIRIKAGIGRLSAYCGAVSAGVGAGAAICFLHGGGYDEIAHTIINALGIASGIVCDGAKSSCAAKIASAVEAGLLGFQMNRNGSQFHGGDGILAGDVEKTIDNVGELARIGMRGTDEEIIKIMIESLK